MLNRSIQESYLMGANILSNMANAEEQNAYGLLLNHSYSIIHCEEFKGEEGLSDIWRSVLQTLKAQGYFKFRAQTASHAQPLVRLRGHFRYRCPSVRVVRRLLTYLTFFI
jgi:hypothetical protein